MHLLSDEELLKELADRVEEKNRALFDLRMTTRRLEEVNRKLVESEALKGHFVSDCIMPVMDGISFVREVKQTSDNVAAGAQEFSSIIRQGEPERL